MVPTFIRYICHLHIFFKKLFFFNDHKPCNYFPNSKLQTCFNRRGIKIIAVSISYLSYLYVYILLTFTIVIIDKYGMTKRLGWGGCHNNHYKPVKINHNQLKIGGRCANKLSNWWTNSGDLLKVNFWVVTFFVRNFYKCFTKLV